MQQWLNFSFYFWHDYTITIYFSAGSWAQGVTWAFYVQGVHLKFWVRIHIVIKHFWGLSSDAMWSQFVTLNNEILNGSHQVIYLIFLGEQVFWRFLGEFWNSWMYPSIYRIFKWPPEFLGDITLLLCCFCFLIMFLSQSFLKLPLME